LKVACRQCQKNTYDNSDAAHSGHGNSMKFLYAEKISIRGEMRMQMAIAHYPERYQQRNQKG
jgi:hypothetical protein